MKDLQVLIVEGDAANRSLCEQLLKKEGFAVIGVQGGEEAKAALSDRAVDVVLLDLNLPDCDGLSLCRTLCSSYRTPIVMMSVRDSPEQRFAGLSAGAVDYLVKPFHSGELLLRLKRIVENVKPAFDRPRLGANHTVSHKVLIYGPWQLDQEESLLRIGDASPIRLTAGQTEIMSLLIAAHGRTVGKAVIQKAVARGWGGNSKTVGVLISRLRKSMAAGTEGGIEAVYGVGYRLRLPESK